MIEKASEAWLVHIVADILSGALDGRSNVVILMAEIMYNYPFSVPDVWSGCLKAVCSSEGKKHRHRLEKTSAGCLTKRVQLIQHCNIIVTTRSKLAASNVPTRVHVSPFGGWSAACGRVSVVIEPASD